MSKIVIELDDQEVMRIEMILMDEDRADALLFLKEEMKPNSDQKALASWIAPNPL